MSDGPDILKLFTETNCLNVQSNLKEICKYLRFFKSEQPYQTYLKKYLPLLATPELKDTFNEFIVDLEDKDLAEELKKGLVPKKPEPTPEALAAIAALEEEKKEEVKVVPVEKKKKEKKL